MKQKFLEIVSSKWFWILLFVLAIIIALIFFRNAGKESGDKATGTASDPDAVIIGTLPGELEYYRSIADMQYEALNGYATSTVINSLPESYFTTLETLTADELKAVYKAFGLRASSIAWFPGSWAEISDKRNLIQWYYMDLNSRDLAKMKAIWSKTGLM